jgi:ribose 5-phosphate isomerase B
MKIYLASDHGGFEQKEQVKAFFQELETEIKIIDCGAKDLDPIDDYPDYAFDLAEKMTADADFETEDIAASNSKVLGLLFCRSGSGMVMAANKVKGIRAVELYDEKIAEHAKSHNYANVLAFGSNYLEFEEVIKILEKYLKTDFDRDLRHRRRVSKISDYELDK